MLNQGQLNAEKISYRLVLKSGASTVHPVLGTFTQQGSIPLPLSGTGTISTVNTDTSGGTLVSGVGTTFMGNDATTTKNTSLNGTMIMVGDFLASNANGQYLRRITGILSDTQLTIEAKFPTQLTGANLFIVRKNRYKMITAKSVGTGTAQLQEQDFPQNETFLNGGSPVYYDVTTSNAQIDFQIDY